MRGSSDPPPPKAASRTRRGAATIRLLLSAGLVLIATAAFDMTRPPEHQLSASAAGALISAYQATVSPLLERAGVHCRFEPTCSEYTRATIRSQGFAAGSLRGLARLVRCGPWTPAGTVDPPTLLAGAPTFRPVPD